MSSPGSIMSRSRDVDPYVRPSRTKNASASTPEASRTATPFRYRRRRGDDVGRLSTLASIPATQVLAVPDRASDCTALLTAQP